MLYIYQFCQAGMEVLKVRQEGFWKMEIKFVKCDKFSCINVVTWLDKSNLFHLQTIFCLPSELIAFYFRNDETSTIYLNYSFHLLLWLFSSRWTF